MTFKFDSKKLAADILNKRIKDDLSFRTIKTKTRGKLSIASLQRIEAGTQIPKADTLADICNWLEKDISIYFK